MNNPFLSESLVAALKHPPQTQPPKEPMTTARTAPRTPIDYYAERTARQIAERQLAAPKPAPSATYDSVSLPWQIHSQYSPNTIIGDLDGPLEDGQMHYREVATCEHDDDAELIVRCVNAHDDLVSALAQAIARIQIDGAQGGTILQAWLPSARAALAKAVA